MKKDRESKIKLIESLTEHITNENLELLLQFVNSADLSVKLSAIETLACYKDYPIAKTYLEELIDDSNVEVRCKVLESLKNFTGETIWEKIVIKLSDTNNLVKIVAAETLGELKLNKAIPNLLESLHDKNELVRAYVVEALGNMNDTKLVRELENKLNEEKRNAVRLRLYLALYKLGEKQYFKQILNLLKSKSYKIRCATANGIVQIADDNNIDIIVQELKKSLSKEQTIAAESCMVSSLEELKNYKASFVKV